MSKGHAVMKAGIIALTLASALASACVSAPKTPPRPAAPARPSARESTSAVTAPGVPKSFPTNCVGKAGASRNLIFLHGIMPRGPVPPELDYEPELGALAKELDLRIALPRSTTYCKGSKDKYCWTGETAPEIAATYGAVVRSAEACFGPGKSFGLVGFSNGGYHVGRVVMRCLAPKPQYVIAIGSAGDLAHSEGRDLARCAPTTILIGDKDITRDAARRFAERLGKQKLPVTFRTFAGGHDVPFDVLRVMLSQRGA